MKSLFLNGTIITMDGPDAEAVLVEDGDILAVGDADALRIENPDAEVHDLEGRALMPGFVDAHGHFTAYAMSLLQLSLREARDIGTLLSVITGIPSSRYRLMVRL